MTVETRIVGRVPRLITAADRAQVFRRCLEVLAEPGVVRDLAAVFADRCDAGASECSIASAPVLVLSDLLTPLAALPGDDAAVEEITRVAALTHAPILGHEEARLVLALQPPRREGLLGLHRGTLLEPHTAALLVVGVESVGAGAGRLLRLTGPGIRDVAELTVDGLGDDLLAARAEALDYPLGFDLLLVDPQGRMAGLPRTTRVEVTS